MVSIFLIYYFEYHYSSLQFETMFLYDNTKGLFRQFFHYITSIVSKFIVENDIC